MKEEIKEILDNLKDYSLHEYLPPCCELTNEECKQLLDYITNLQEELKSSNESITWWTNRFNALQKGKETIKSKIKTDIDLLKNYEFDKYNWNYMEQQAVAEYLEKEILKEGK